MELDKNIEYTTETEIYLKHIGEKCYAYSVLHKKSQARYNFRKTFIELPVIVLSTLSGSLSLSSSSLFPDYEKQATMGIGLLSLGIGVLQTINTYFAFNKRCENHRFSNQEFSKLFRMIQIQLNLPRENRMSCSDFLKLVREQFERLIETSPLIDGDIIEEVKLLYKKYDKFDVGMPSECNGLEIIEIYKEEHINKKTNLFSENEYKSFHNSLIKSIKQEQDDEILRRDSENSIDSNLTIISPNNDTDNNEIV